MKVSIVVETDDREPTRVVKLTDGRVKFETITTSENNIQLSR